MIKHTIVRYKETLRSIDKYGRQIRSTLEQDSRNQIETNSRIQFKVEGSIIA